MIILPAIDMYEGMAVRLYKGDYEQMTIYDKNPINTAKKFEAEGAKWIHLVDLEGAKDGDTPNMKTACEIIDGTRLKAEIGGGIRDMATIEKYINIGVSRVILGTAAVRDEKLVSDAVQKYGDKIATGADIKDGVVAIKGWMEKTGFTLHDFCSKMESIGVKTIICTDVSKDGAMNGTNREMYKDLSERYDINFIASGGVSSIDDVKALSNMGMYGAIVGKAYYTGAIKLSEAIMEAR